MKIQYKPEYCELVTNMMSEGTSIEEVVASLGIVKQTFYNWCEKYPDLMDAKKRGVEMSTGWWYKQGRVHLENNKFNYTGWYMQMKNRFGWADKQEVAQQTDATVNFKFES